MVCIEIVTCFDYSSFLITDGVLAQANNLSNYNHEIAFTFIFILEFGANFGQIHCFWHTALAMAFYALVLMRTVGGPGCA